MALKIAIHPSISQSFFWRPLFTITPKREPFSELTFLHLAFGCEKVGLEFNWRKQILMLEGNIPSMRVRVKIASFGYDSLMMYMLLLISETSDMVCTMNNQGMDKQGDNLSILICPHLYVDFRSSSNITS